MKRYLFFPLFVLIFGCSSQSTLHQSQSQPETNGTWLPNGQYLTPAGRSIPIGEFPLGFALSPDKKTLVIVNSGYNEHTLSLVNVAKQTMMQSLIIRKSWMGAVWGPYGDYFFATGGNDNKVYRYGFEKDSAWFVSSIPLGKEAPAEFISPAGLTVNKEGDKIFTVSRTTPFLFKLNAYDNKIENKLEFDSPLYTCVLDEDRTLIYVSEWGASRIAVVHSDSLVKILDVPVGRHPSAMVMNSLRSHLFVTNSSDNTVSVVNLQTLNVEETINVAPMPNSPAGSTPNALALSANDSLLYVALADNNAVAVVDVKNIGASSVKGFIPTGWYPTAVMCIESVLVVANGKGESSGRNFNKENPFDFLKGTVSFIPLPTDEQLKKFTAEVFHNNPYTREKSYTDWNIDSPVPKSEHQQSPIKHIFYVVKEMRSYDDVFGDVNNGNGDSTLSKYGRMITPNHHALAEEFTLFDNFYVAGQTSANGMQWSTAAYATDYVEKTIPTLYGRRGGQYDYEQEGISVPASGYIWDAVQKKNLTIRNYGMFLNEEASERGEIIPMVKGLFTVTSPTFRGWDLNYYDTARVSAWAKEFDAYERGDSLPTFSIIRLPNDHTGGKNSRVRTQSAFVADNDLALGKIVEKISHSKYWKESAVFVLESSANGGADHVDAHRSVALVISPYIKRNFVDHTQYTTTSMLRTMELILGIPPMTQHDAGAAPMYRAFQTTPDITPYTAKQNIIPLNEVRVVQPRNY